jgi:hypothetical protein
MATAVCKVCSEKFRYYSSRSTGQFCTHACSNVGRRKGGPKRTGRMFPCTECGKEFWQYASCKDRTRCSIQCANKFKSALFQSDPSKLANLRRASTFRDTSSQAFRERMSHQAKRAYSEGRLKPKRGELSPWWKGGVSSINKRLRETAEYKTWRLSVFTRDDFQCYLCSSSKDLQAHHIKEFSKYPDLRFEVSNGVTLCHEHHEQMHGRHIPKRVYKLKETLS